jgi:hypothetical protein
VLLPARFFSNHPRSIQAYRKQQSNFLASGDFIKADVLDIQSRQLLARRSGMRCHAATKLNAMVAIALMLAKASSRVVMLAAFSLPVVSTTLNALTPYNLGFSELKVTSEISWN